MKAGKRCQVGWSLLPLRAIRIQAGAVEGGITYILVYPFEYDRSVSNFELFFLPLIFFVPKMLIFRLAHLGFIVSQFCPNAF